MKDLCDQSPFNLKRDIKDLSESTLNELQENIANELKYDQDHPPVCSPVYWHSSRKAMYVKIRTVDSERNAGKSGGYRSIVLVDTERHYAFVLHIYRHSHGEDDNISKRDQNTLRRLVDAYVESMNSYLNSD